MQTTPTLFIFGNEDLPEDSLPLRLIPHLKKIFPKWAFVTLDPNEEWEVPKDMLILDTVVSIETVSVFHNLSHFIQAPRLTCHDFDAYANLLFLQKLKKIEKVTIIGVPPTTEEDEALRKVVELLKNNFNIA